jgi:hypothetical protein
MSGWRRRLLLLVAAVAALSGSAPAIAVVSGEQSLLVIRVTWGPKPFATEDVNQVLDSVDACFRAVVLRSRVVQEHRDTVGRAYDGLRRATHSRSRTPVAGRIHR